MWHYPEIDPVALSLGPIQIHWYGVTYLVGLSLAWWLLRKRALSSERWTADQITDLIFYGAIGIVLGGRIGYMLFYGWANLVENPLDLFKVWQGGMSFHGGMIGVILAEYLYTRKHRFSFIEIVDFIAPAAPLGLGMGRLGNFINAELPGRVTDVPWALIYPGDSVGRHPSSLYQFALEGLVLFLILYFFSIRTRPHMAVSGLFLLLYGGFRCFSELFREPDAHLQFVAFGWLTMGQALSSPMVILGMIFLYLAYSRSGRASSGR
jgi:phosphatidylglycerol:prolipoprotein diacylglycerol transferase